MGLGVDAIQLLSLLKQNGYLTGEASVIEIGAQQLATSFLKARRELDAIASLFNISGSCPLPEAEAAADAHGSLEPLARGAPYARDFWHWLGFRYAALDFEGPDSTPLDLNFDSTPPELAGAFLLVTNFGTTEHIANQLNAFNVIHDLAAPRGLMIHHVPFQGMLNHGLVNYNFKFFWMLCRGNNYRIIMASLSGAGNAYPLPQNILAGIPPFHQPLSAPQPEHP